MRGPALWVGLGVLAEGTMNVSAAPDGVTKKAVRKIARRIAADVSAQGMGRVAAVCSTAKTPVDPAESGEPIVQLTAEIEAPTAGYLVLQGFMDLSLFETFKEGCSAT